jgi:hypothetical protein
MAKIIGGMSEEEKDLAWNSEGWVDDKEELKREDGCYFERSVHMVDHEIGETIEMCRPLSEVGAPL